MIIIWMIRNITTWDYQQNNRKNSQIGQQIIRMHQVPARFIWKIYWLMEIFQDVAILRSISGLTPMMKVKPVWYLQAMARRLWWTTWFIQQPVILAEQSALILMPMPLVRIHCRDMAFCWMPALTVVENWLDMHCISAPVIQEEFKKFLWMQKPLWEQTFQ